MVVSFANSDGCTPKSPMPIQARAPFTSLPNSAVSASSTTPHAYRYDAPACNQPGPAAATTARSANPVSAQTICLIHSCDTDSPVESTPLE